MRESDAVVECRYCRRRWRTWFNWKVNRLEWRQVRNESGQWSRRPTQSQFKLWRKAKSLGQSWGPLGTGHPRSFSSFRHGQLGRQTRSSGSYWWTTILSAHSILVDKQSSNANLSTKSSHDESTQQPKSIKLIYLWAIQNHAAQNNHLLFICSIFDRLKMCGCWTAITTGNHRLAPYTWLPLIWYSSIRMRRRKLGYWIHFFSPRSAFRVVISSTRWTNWWTNDLIIFVQVLLMHVATVQKLPLSTVGAPLQIRCKTFLSVTFVLPRERECHDLYTSLMQMSQPCKRIDFFFF